ncbi:hypothetical protein ACFE04_031738 [Oxalis oulophora]
MVITLMISFLVNFCLHPILEHPSLGSNNWGGASPLLARDIPKKSLEQRYIKINSIRSQDEIFPVDDIIIYLPQAQVAPRPHKGLLWKLIRKRKEKGVAVLGSTRSKKRFLPRWDPKTRCRWDPKTRWPQGWC